VCDALDGDVVGFSGGGVLFAPVDPVIAKMALLA
jgi:hypothetical protein